MLELLKFKERGNKMILEVTKESISKLNERDLYKIYREFIPNSYGYDIAKRGGCYYSLSNNILITKKEKITKNEAIKTMIKELYDYLTYNLGYSKIELKGVK